MGPSEKTPKADYLEALRAQHNARSSLLQSFGDAVTNELQKLLLDARIALGFPIQCRVKSFDSIADKVERLSLSIQNIEDLQDLVGHRIVLLFRRDVAAVTDLISQHLAVLRKYDTGERLKTDQFGYSSIHLIVELPKAWLAVPTLSRMGGLKSEIQVRTLSQHTWAEASHTLQYKREEAVPASIRRAIYRASALLETLDLEFERVLKEREEYRATAETRSLEHLNVDIIAKILDEMLPAQNKGPREDYADLLTDLVHFGISTTEELRRLIEQYLPHALAVDKTVAESRRRSTYYVHTGLVREMLGKHVGTEAFNEYMTERAYEASDEDDFHDVAYGDET